MLNNLTWSVPCNEPKLQKDVGRIKSSTVIRPDVFKGLMFVCCLCYVIWWQYQRSTSVEGDGEGEGKGRWSISMCIIWAVYQVVQVWRKRSLISESALYSVAIKGKVHFDDDELLVLSRFFGLSSLPLLCYYLLSTIAPRRRLSRLCMVNATGKKHIHTHHRSTAACT